VLDEVERPMCFMEGAIAAGLAAADAILMAVKKAA
jgi:hypothetical protein